MKLQKIQAELKVPKNQKNDFGKYYYRSCEDILEMVKPILAKYGAVITLTDEIVLVGERYYVKATATLISDEGQSITTAFAREEDTKKGMDASQITGSASSYARKYALNGLLAIDDTKDSDSTNQGEEINEVKNLPTAEQIARLKELDINPDKVADYYKKDFQNITAEEIQSVIERKEKALKKAEEKK